MVYLTQNQNQIQSQKQILGNINIPPNINSQNIIYQNQNINQKNQSPLLLNQKNVNVQPVILNSNPNPNQTNQFNAQFGSSQIININNINNQIVNESFKLELFTTDNAQNPLGFNKQEIDNIFDNAFKNVSFPGNNAPGTGTNTTQNKKSQKLVRKNQLSNEQINDNINDNQQTGQIDNINIDEIFKQQNNQQPWVNIDDLFKQTNNQQQGLQNINNQTNSQINNLYFSNQNNLNLAKTMPPKLPTNNANVNGIR